MHYCSQLYAGRISSLSWSSDSNLLTIQYEPLPESVQQQHSTEIWTRSNWRWYLKQELTFGSAVVRLQWSQEGSNMLTASCQEGNIRQVIEIYQKSLQGLRKLASNLPCYHDEVGMSIYSWIHSSDNCYDKLLRAFLPFLSIHMR